MCVWSGSLVRLNSHSLGAFAEILPDSNVNSIRYVSLDHTTGQIRGEIKPVRMDPRPTTVPHINSATPFNPVIPTLHLFRARWIFNEKEIGYKPTYIQQQTQTALLLSSCTIQNQYECVQSQKAYCIRYIHRSSTISIHSPFLHLSLCDLPHKIADRSTGSKLQDITGSDIRTAYWAPKIEETRLVDELVLDVE